MQPWLRFPAYAIMAVLLLYSSGLNAAVALVSYHVGAPIPLRCVIWRACFPLNFDAAPADEAGVELAPVGAVFEVRVLDVKDQGAVHVVRVPEGGSVDDLMGAVAAAVAGAPVGRQRLIAGGRQLRAGDALADHGISRSARTPTVHLMVRPEDAGALPEARPVDAEVANPLHENLAAVVAAAAREHRDGGAARSVGQRPLETVARSAARVRLLSSLLALYCALNGLGALLDATADPNRTFADLFAFMGVAYDARRLAKAARDQKAKRPAAATFGDRLSKVCGAGTDVEVTSAVNSGSASPRTCRDRPCAAASSRWP